MDKRLLERLVESMQQHEEIRRDERAPSREFFVVSRSQEQQTAQGLECGHEILVCITRGEFAADGIIERYADLELDVRALPHE